MKFRDLRFPKGLNLELLATVLPEKRLMKLALDNVSKSRKQRRIILPSKSCFKKVVAYYFGTQVEQAKMTWDEVMEIMKNSVGIQMLKDGDFARKEFKRLFVQRKQEILKEKRKDEFNL